MADQNYQLFEYAFHNRGIVAKFVSDDSPPQMYANLESCEVRQENTIGSRLGPAMITTNGFSNVPLGDTNVHTLRRLKGIGSTWRYAGAGFNLYRRTGDTNGAYATINTSPLSGNRFSSDVYRPAFSSFPYLFVADQSAMLKDNGTGNAQNWGIPGVPTVPPTIQLQANQFTLVDGVSGGIAHSTVNVTGFGGANIISATMGAVGSAGIQTVTPSNMTNIQPFRILVINPGGGNQETVVVISVTATTFTAQFSQTHAGGESIQDVAYGGSVASATTATITRAQAFNLATLGGSTSPITDLISLYVQVSDPSLVFQVQLKFDVGDGSFSQSFYMTTLSQTQFQSLISGQVPSTSALSAVVAARAAGILDRPTVGHEFISLLPGDVTDPTGGGSTQIIPLVPTPILTGLSQWTLVQVQKGTFITVGQAGQPGHDWAAVNGVQIVVQTVNSAGITFNFTDVALIGGSALSSLGGVAYDYRITYFNNNTDGESNPSQPLISSSALLAVNQPIKISWTASTDPQVTHVRVYRRGGSVTDGNWHLVAQVAIGVTSYIDVIADSLVVSGQLIALDNDAPVTTTLPVPVNTNLGTNVPAGALTTVTPGSLTNIFANQVMTVGVGAAQEVVYVQSVNTGAGQFTAFFQNAHVTTDIITADTRPSTPMNLFAVAFDIAWFAGDTNNPHLLYFSKRFNPEAVPPQNELEIGKPDDPITALVSYRGLLYVFTISAIYSVYAPGGAVPQPFDTAEKTYGCVANFGICVGNGEIRYQSKDGIRRFSGGASTLMTLNVDWLQTGQTLGPIVPADPTRFSSTLMEYFNRMMFISYVDINGVRRRLIWEDDWQRFRNDDLIANGIFVERDTNKLLFSDLSGNIFQDRVNNFDDGGFVGGVQVKNAIPMTLQTQPQNQGKAKFQKNYQETTLKIDTQGETVTVQLVFNDGLGPTLTLGTITQNGMAVVNLPKINGDNGQLGYNVALKITGNVKNVVTVREWAIKFAWETDTRQVMDTYWLDDNSPEWQQLKQTWINYVTPGNQPITVNVYVDGVMSSPEFTFQLPATTIRHSFRQRLSPILCRTYRVVASSTADFMWYNESFIERKPVTTQKGYQKRQLQAAA